jgi:hypothetical protein
MKAHAVPQEIMSREFKLFGNFLSLREFLFIAGGMVIAYIFYFFMSQGLFPPLLAWPAILLFGLGGAMIGLVPIQDRSLDTWIMNYFQAIQRPTQRVWKKKGFDPMQTQNNNTPGVSRKDHLVAPPTTQKKKVVGTTKDKTEAPTKKALKEEEQKKLEQEEITRLKEIEKSLRENMPVTRRSSNTDVSQKQTNIKKPQSPQIELSNSPSKKTQVQHSQPNYDINKDNTKKIKKTNQMQNNDQNQTKNIDQGEKANQTNNMSSVGTGSTTQNDSNQSSASSNSSKSAPNDNIGNTASQHPPTDPSKQQNQSTQQEKPRQPQQEQPRQPQQEQPRQPQQERPRQPQQEQPRQPQQERPRQPQQERPRQQSHPQQQNVQQPQQSSRTQQQKALQPQPEQQQPSQQQPQPNPQNASQPQQQAPAQTQDNQQAQTSQDGDTPGRITITDQNYKKFQTNMPGITPNPNTINLIIKDQQGQTIPKVTCIVKNKQGDPVRAAVSNQLGQIINNVPLDSGTYQLQLSKQGYVFPVITRILTGKSYPALEIKSL